MTPAGLASDAGLLPVVEPPPTRPRLPEWLRVNLPSGRGQRVFNLTQGAVAENGLHTVCEEARCPNIHDCWARGTATFMVAGESCTRGCRFCSVETLRAPAAPDAAEPERLADAVERLALSYVVITVVNRDDLADGGASHYRSCVDAVHRRLPDVGIELLSSDLGGDWRALEALLVGIPLRVFAHNVECVPRLDREVRDPRASFVQSFDVLRRAKALRPDLPTKTSLMVGLGETDDELLAALGRLRDAAVDLLTLGQYIAPGRPGSRFLPSGAVRAAREVRRMGISGARDGVQGRGGGAAGAQLISGRGALAVSSRPLIRSSD